MTIDVTAQLKKFFFDRAKVKMAVDKTKYQALYKAGAFTRQTARRDVLRRRKRVSNPGEPPSVHSRDRFANLRNILYGISKNNESVIIGTRKLNQQQQSWITMRAVSVPAVLEYGDVVVLREQSYDGIKWYRRDLRRKTRPGIKYRKRTVRIKARPFMSVAGAITAAKFPSFFHNSFKRAA